MHSSPQIDAGADVVDDQTAKKVTVVLQEWHAPGVADLLSRLPSRTEGTFFRALIYQWLMKSAAAGDLGARLMAVLDGPGGRLFMVAPGASFKHRAPRPAAKAPQKQQKQQKPPKSERRTAAVTHAAPEPTRLAPAAQTAGEIVVELLGPTPQPLPDVHLPSSPPPAAVGATTPIHTVEQATTQDPSPPSCDELNPFEAQF